jgi:ribosomal protein S12 methylthiotransferase
MRRTTSKERIIDTIETLRKELPEVSIRTSLIVGFPGETEAQFDELCRFLETYRLDNVGIFAYSKEEESHSATLPNHLPEEVKQDRCERLSAIQRAIVDKRHRKLIGKRFPVIIDSFHPETKLLMVGRLSGQCPEIDPVVLINDCGPVSAFGVPYLVEITDISEYDLLGKVIKPINRKEWS